MLLAGGKAVLNDDCCCCPGPYGESFRMITSGITPCACREFHHGEIRNVTLPSFFVPVWDGTEFLSPTAGTADRWEGVSCDELELQNTDGVFYARGLCVAGTLVARVMWSPFFGSFEIFVFGATFTAMGQTKPNIFSGCSDSFDYFGGGNMTILPP